MAITTTTGHTFLSGDTVTAANMNAQVNSMTISLATAKLMARTTAGTGAVEEADFSALAQTLLAQTTAGAMRSTIGVLGTVLTDTKIAQTQAGALGANQVFTAGPTVNITVGTWLVLGAMTCRTSDFADTIWMRFNNSTDGTDFGYGSCVEEGGLTNRFTLYASGVVTVAGTKTIYTKGFRSGSSSLDLGSAGTNSPAGTILAIQLTA